MSRHRRFLIVILSVLSTSQAHGQQAAQSFDVGITTPLNRVFTERPATFQGQRTHTASVELARNEYEATQLVVFPSVDIKHLTVSAGQLRHASGGQPIPVADVEINLIGEVNLAQPRFATNAPGWYPDPLLPNDYVDVAHGSLQSYLVTIHTRENTPAGDFSGTLKLRAETTGGATVTDSVVLRAHVWNFALPKTPHLKTAAVCNWGLPARMWPGAKLTAEQSMPAMLKLAELGYRNRLPPSTCLANGLSSWNWKGDGNTSYGFPTHDGAQFNASRTGKLIDFMLDHGANNFFIALTGDPYAIPTKSAEREHALGQYLSDYASYLQSRKLVPLAYIYGVDEPWGDAVVNARRVYGVAKQAAPRVPFMQNTNQNTDRAIPAFLGAFDALDINLGWFDSTRVASVRQKNPASLRDLWWNINAWPETHPNLFLEYPLADARIIGPMSYKFAIQGFEYWDLMSEAGIKSYHPLARGEVRVKWDVGRASLDGVLVYPGIANQEIYSSLRFENLRDGFEDAEYLYILSEKDPKSPLLAVSIVSGINKFATNPEALLAFRRSVAAAIEAHR